MTIIAQKELDEVVSTWRQEISKEQDKVKSMYNKYQAEQVLLTDELKKQREEEIVAKETGSKGDEQAQIRTRRRFV